MAGAPSVGSLLRAYRGRALFLSAVAVLAPLAWLPWPLVLQWAIDDALIVGDRRALVRAIVAMVALGAVGVAGRLVAQWSAVRLGAQIVHDLRARLSRRLVATPLGFVERRDPGETIAPLVSGVELVDRVLGSTLPQAVASAGMAVATAVGLFLLDPVLACAPLVAAAVMEVANRPLTTLRAAARRLREGAVARFVGQLVQWLAPPARRLTLAHGIGVAVGGRLVTASRKLMLRHIPLGRLEHGAFAVFQAGEVLGTALVFALALLVPAGQPTPGTVLAMVAMQSRLLGAVGMVLAARAEVRECNAALGGLRAIATEPTEPRSGVRLPRRPTELRLERVSWSTPQGRRVLDCVTTSVPARGLVQVVGPPGAGKSTLARALVGFLDGMRGRVLVDGVDTATADRDALRRTIHVVEQHPATLPEETVRLNVTLFSDTTDDLIRAQAARVGLGSLLERRQLDEPLGAVSGGEGRLIGLLRVLVAPEPPAIVVLDEPTGALDAVHARRVNAVIDDLVSQGVGVIVITHRPRPDGVVAIVLRDGRIVEQGVPHELMARDSELRRLARAWDA